MIGVHDFIVAGVMILLFLVVLIAFTWAVGKKAAILMKILRMGAKKEFKTSPGFFSLAIVAIVTLFGFGIVLLSEVSNTVTRLLHSPIDASSGSNAIAIAAIGMAGIVNMILLGVANFRDPR
ncbi:MAG: hypothetical protein ACLQME_21250 [Alphaproteobacteria bacterium]